MKKSLLTNLVIIITLLHCSLKMSGQEYYRTTYDNLKYLVMVNGYAVVDQQDENLKGTIIIPDSISYEGTKYPVTKIGTYAFNNTHIEEITISPNVLTIEDKAFYNCKNLIIFNIAKGDMSLTFNSTTEPCFGSDDNSQKLDSLYVGRNITYTTRIFPFANQPALSRVGIDENVTTLPPYFLFGNSKLEYLSIPASITSIGNNAFSMCQNLKVVKGLKENSKITALPSYLFSGCQSLQEAAIPVNAKSVGDHCFFDCRKISELTLGKKLTTIGSCAFDGCSSLHKLTIEDNTASLYFENKVSSCFKNAPLDTLYIGRTLTKATTDYTMFAGEKALKSVILSNYVTTIPNFLFYNCTSLSAITIPASVNMIDEYAFDGCSSLKVLTFEPSKTPLKINNKKSNCFEGNIIETLILGRNLTFYNTDSPTIASLIHLKHLNLLGNVTAINDYGFSQCDSIEDIYLDANLTYGTSASFSGKPLLKRLEIGENVTIIASGLFSSCMNLDNIYSKASVPPVLGTNNFKTTGVNIEVPIGSESAYRGVANWFNDSKNHIYSLGEEPLYIVLDENTHLQSLGSRLDSIGSIKITGEFNQSDWDLLLSMKQLSSVDLGGTDITEIPDSAFMNKNLVSMTLPGKIQKIGKCAFFNNPLITSQIEAPASLIEVGDKAFYDCSGIKGFALKGHTAIGNYAFMGCKSLETFAMSDTIKYSGNRQYSTTAIDSLTPIITKSDSLMMGNEAIDTIPLNDSFQSTSSVIKGTMWNKRVVEELDTIQNVSKILLDNTEEKDIYNNCIIDTLVSRTVTNICILDSIAMNRKIMAEYTDSTKPMTYYVDSIFYKTYNDTLNHTKEIHVDTVSTTIEYTPGLTIAEGIERYDSIIYSDTVFINTLDSIEVAISKTDYEKFQVLGEDSTFYFTNIDSTVIIKTADIDVIDVTEVHKSPSTIGNFALSNSGIKDMFIPVNLSTIGTGVWDGCDSLNHFIVATENKRYASQGMYLTNKLQDQLIKAVTTAVTADYEIPASFTKIGAYAFANLQQIEKLSIPSSIQSIGDNAFKNCKQLRYVKVGWETPIAIAEGTFAGEYSTCLLCVPSKESISLYKESSGWKNFAIIDTDSIPDNINMETIEEQQPNATYNNGLLNVKGLKRGTLIVLYNSWGEKLKETIHEANETQMQLLDLKKGIYIIKAGEINKKILIY